MKFIDHAQIYVKSGDGGEGHISFRKEKFVPKGGPDGGNGGKGGDVVAMVEKNLNTLMDYKYKRHYKADDGKPGQKSRKSGKDGIDLIIKVPPGTVIKDASNQEILADLTDENTSYIIAKGGKGGHGNSEFATSTNQAPRYAEPGLPGKELNIILELKLIADVGLVGFPNSGKSTLISSISAAKPKIADYPFTTLIPNLGIVSIGDWESFTIADIPGLIEGAHEGKGLGHQFLRHVERTNLLVFLIDCTSENPVEDYEILKNELNKFNSEMLDKHRIICLSKIDIMDKEMLSDLEKLQFNDDAPLMMISSVAQINLDKFKYYVWNKIKKDL